VLEEESSVVRKTIGAIVGFAILFGLLFTVVLYTWPKSTDMSKAESQALAKLGHRLATVNDLERRGILPEKIAEAERQHYSIKAQTALSEAHFQALVEIKYKIATIDDLQERGILAAKVANAEKQRYLVQAQAIVGKALDSDQLSILLRHLDSGQLAEAQQAAQNDRGFSVPTIAWVLLGLLLVILAGWLIQPYLSSVRERLPPRRKPIHTPIPSPHAAEADKGAPSHTSLTPPTPPAATSLESFDSQPTFAESLTKRELEVLALVAKGLTNREIAQKLIITPGTAKVHISNIYSKLSVNRRVQAVAKAQEMGILASKQ
jgi:DNA-binding CsgD family transcriptional regulator